MYIPWYLSSSFYGRVVKNRSLPVPDPIGGISVTVYIADVTIHILRQR